MRGATPVTKEEAMSKIAALKKKMCEVRLEFEMEVAKYVNLHPDESLRAIASKQGMSAARICEIAKKHGVRRKSAAAENI
jgi:hypothetical protein